MESWSRAGPISGPASLFTSARPGFQSDRRQIIRDVEMLEGIVGIAGKL